MGWDTMSSRGRDRLYELRGDNVGQEERGESMIKLGKIE